MREIQLVAGEFGEGYCELCEELIIMSILSENGLCTVSSSKMTLLVTKVRQEGESVRSFGVEIIRKIFGENCH